MVLGGAVYGYPSGPSRSIFPTGHKPCGSPPKLQCGGMAQSIPGCPRTSGTALLQQVHRCAQPSETLRRPGQLVTYVQCRPLSPDGLNATTPLPTTVTFMISAIITLSPDTSTLSGVRNLLTEAARFNIPAETVLIDGGHVALASDPAHTIMNYGLDLQAVIRFCEATMELDDDTEILFGADLAIDLVVLGASPISCSAHVDQTPDNIMVVVQPTCTGCVD